jgi:hypothetical protein
LYPDAVEKDRRTFVPIADGMREGKGGGGRGGRKVEEGGEGEEGRRRGGGEGRR